MFFRAEAIAFPELRTKNIPSKRNCICALLFAFFTAGTRTWVSVHNLVSAITNFVDRNLYFPIRTPHYGVTLRRDVPSDRLYSTRLPENFAAHFAWHSQAAADSQP